MPRTLDLPCEPACVAMIRWPLPYEGDPNVYEIVGRFMWQAIHMERLLDIVLLERQVGAARLQGMTLSEKIKALRALLDRDDLGLADEWTDVPDRLEQVRLYRNAFAHRFMERPDAEPSHYGQGIPYRPLSDDELHLQIRETVEATEICRQLLECLSSAPLNPEVTFTRSGAQPRT